MQDQSSRIMSKPTLLILAAGMGSRYGGLKQLDPVGPSGETIMDYSVFDALRAGFGKVVFVIRPELEAEFDRVIVSRYRGTIEVACAFQRADDLPGGFTVPAGRTKPWGTGQAVYAAREVVHEPFAVINADDFYGAENFRQLAAFLTAEASGTALLRGALCAFRLDQTLSSFGTVSRGVCAADAAGDLAGVVEHTRLRREEDGVIRERGEDGSVSEFAGETPVSMNSWGFPPELFAELERKFLEFLRLHGQELKSEFYLPAAVDALIREGRARIRLLSSPERWFGVTYREDKPETEAGIRRLIEHGEYPRRLFAR